MKNTPILTAVFITLAVSRMSAVTQTNAQATLQETTPPPSLQSRPAVAPIPHTLPLVDPAKELQGLALVEALRKRGFVLYMRHAETGVVTATCA